MVFSGFFLRANFFFCQIKLKVNVNSLNKFSESPLHMAVIYGNIETVKILLKKGADYTRTTK